MLHVCLVLSNGLTGSQILHLHRFAKVAHALAKADALRCVH
jgi:hypothetical protein